MSTIYTSTLPNNSALNRIRDVKLSREAKHRLAIIDYPHKMHNAIRTCRHYAFAHSYSYKWFRRDNPNLRTFENKSTRPHTPRDKLCVKNLIGELQQEYLDEDRTVMILDERGKQITERLNDYHFFRPHQSLGYLTPSEYCARLGITILRRKVSSM